MSMHWQPDEDLARVRREQGKSIWPEGATAGLLLIAAACVGAAVILYQLAAPRDVFAP